MVDFSARVSEADVDADEAPRPFVGVEDGGEVAQREARAAVVLVVGRAVPGPVDGHQRGDRDLAPAEHAQSGRVDRHRREVAAERREGAGHGHRPRRAEVELRLGELEEVARQEYILVGHQAARVERRLGRGRQHRHQGQHSGGTGCYDSFHFLFPFS